MYSIINTHIKMEEKKHIPVLKDKILSFCWDHFDVFGALKVTVHPKIKDTYFFMLPTVQFIHPDCFGVC